MRRRTSVAGDARAGRLAEAGGFWLSSTGMGRIQRVSGGEVRLLAQRCILGRSRACTLRLREPDVSGEHALLRWTGDAWEVQDLHSRNGTFVDRRRLAPGERGVLQVGAVLGFGQPETFVLVDESAPAVFAVPLDDRAPLEAEGGILALPGPTVPALMVFRGAGGWLLERHGEVSAVADGEVVRVGGDAWQLHLPELLPRTAESTGAAPHVDDIGLQFAVSRDEEYVELVVMHGARTIDLKARSHHYTLLLLARARLRDGGAAPELQGWVHQSELLDLLRCDVSLLHLNIYRLRQQFGEAGIVGAARVVERRAGTRQLRIGVSQLDIRTIEGR